MKWLYTCWGQRPYKILSTPTFSRFTFSNSFSSSTFLVHYFRIGIIDNIIYTLLLYKCFIKVRQNFTCSFNFDPLFLMLWPVNSADYKELEQRMVSRLMSGTSDNYKGNPVSSYYSDNTPRAKLVNVHKTSFFGANFCTTIVI